MNQVVESRYDQLYRAATSAQRSWFAEVSDCQAYAEACRDALVEYYGCPRDRVKLLKIEDDERPDRYNVNPFLEWDERNKCWRFTLRVILRKVKGDFKLMSFSTEFRLRKTVDGYEIAAGEPQPWHKTRSATLDELQPLFVSINDWMMDYLSTGYTHNPGADQQVMGFK